MKRRRKLSEWNSVIVPRAQMGMQVGEIVYSALLLGARVDTLLTDATKREAWATFHPVAHLWAALLKFVPAQQPITTDNVLHLLPETSLPAFLLQSEKILDLMEERPDLRHPEPWRLSADMRAFLQREYGQK